MNTSRPADGDPRPALLVVDMQNGFCQPDCAQGHSHSYPVQAVLSDRAAVANHPGEKHFTKLTLHYPGARPPQYKNGKQVPGPKTVTLSLWSKMP